MRGEGKKEKRLKKAMIAPLVFILPGYFRFFFFFLQFLAEKKICLTEVVYLSVTLLKIQPGYTSKRSRKDPSRVLYAGDCLFQHSATLVASKTILYPECFGTGKLIVKWTHKFLCLPVENHTFSMNLNFNAKD